MSKLYSQQPRVIAIIGGGPAGAATALSLQQSLAAAQAEQPLSYQIHLFNMDRNGGNAGDSRSLTRVGESIPPAATPVLKRLGIEALVKQSNIHVVCPGSISLWNSNKPEHNDFMLDLDGLGYHLDRVKFDAQLLERAAQSGVELHQGWRLAGVNEVAGSKHLNFTVEGKAAPSIAADYVVDATGNGSVFTRSMNVCRNTFDDVIFLSAFVAIPEGEKILPHTFVEAVEQGWWYAARLPNNKMIITFCTDRQNIKQDSWNEPKQWLALLKQTKWLRKNVPASLFNSSEAIAIGIHSAPSSLLSAVCGADWLAVGDAASCYDPITSAGITKALMHGELAGAAIARLLTQQNTEAVLDYQQHVFADFNRYADLRNQLYRSENRFTDSGFWRRRLGK